MGNGKNRCFAADILVNTIVTSSNFLIADVLKRDSRDSVLQNMPKIGLEEVEKI